MRRTGWVRRCGWGKHWVSCDEAPEVISLSASRRRARATLVGCSVTFTVCLGANTLGYPEGGGHHWVFLNWALGFRALGCDVIWLEECGDDLPGPELRVRVEALRSRLRPYGLDDRLALCSRGDLPRSQDRVTRCLDLEEAAGADLLLNASYRLSPRVVARFRRSALLDIDPGLLQRWISRAEIQVARYDLYFSIGETVGRPGARFPDCGVRWLYTPPCVSLDWWPTCPTEADAPFTTVSHWYMHQWVQDDDGEVYENNKRSGFVPYFDLPRHTAQRLELALCLGPGDEGEAEMLRARGWGVRHAHDVAATPWAYQRYIQRSRGEFSGVKPAWVRLQNAWISDRTICYLASGKPAVIQHTGPSRFLPDAAGLFRFQNLAEAARCLEDANRDYDRQSRLARALAEEYFDAKKVAKGVLENATA